MIRPYEQGDMWFVFPNIQPHELEEAHAMGINPLLSIQEAIYRGETYTVVLGGEIAGLAGIVRGGEMSIPWAVFTHCIDAHKKEFIRDCKTFMNQYDAPMWNIVLDRNETSKRWLGWLGFTLGDPFDMNGHQFRPYWRN